MDTFEEYLKKKKRKKKKNALPRDFVSVRKDSSNMEPTAQLPAGSPLQPSLS